MISPVLTSSRQASSPFTTTARTELTISDSRCAGRGNSVLEGLDDDMPAIDLGDREAAEHQDAQHQLDALHSADQGATEERPSHDIKECHDP